MIQMQISKTPRRMESDDSTLVHSSVVVERAIRAFVEDAHSRGVVACVQALDDYPLNDVQRTTIVATYDRYRSYDTDLWTRLIDALYGARAIDDGTFQEWNDRRARDASFDERRLLESRQVRASTTGHVCRADGGHVEPLDSDDSTRIPLQLCGALDDLDDLNERHERAIDCIASKTEGLCEYVSELDRAVGDLRSALEHIHCQCAHKAQSPQSQRAPKPVELHYRRVDDEPQQIQFFGPSTFAARELLKPLGATWNASNRRWNVSKENGEQFMTEHAGRFVFRHVDSTDADAPGSPRMLL
jgi:hypothetical protein